MLSSLITRRRCGTHPISPRAPWLVLLLLVALEFAEEHGGWTVRVGLRHRGAGHGGVWIEEVEQGIRLGW